METQSTLNQGVVQDTGNLDTEIRDKVHALYLDRLAYREIVEKLVEKGYNRELVVAVIHKMTRQRHIESRFSMPIIFLVVSVILFFWGITPTSQAAPDAIKVAKIAGVGLGGLTLLPALFTIILQWYDHIPGLRSILEPIMFRRRLLKQDVAALDDQFRKGNLTDGDYRGKLFALLGDAQGRRHYLWMRNQKHFGLE